MPNLEDRFGRRFSYLRLSVIDACNFRCNYCLPQGYVKTRSSNSSANDDLEKGYLTLQEIKNLVSAMSALGTWKIRVTGGEPTLRRDLISIIETVSEIPGIKKVALSTNGYRLKAMAQDLKSAGVSALNVSVDSLNPDQFKELTGYDRLEEILAGIEKSIDLGFESIKVNAVLLKDCNELELFLEWIKSRPITVRFIELMPTGQNQAYFTKYHVESKEIQNQFLSLGWRPRQRIEADGPALEFIHPDYVGRLGIIAPYSSDFCSTCNRLRVTSTGGLRLCLFGEGNYSIRHLLQDSSRKEELMNLILSFVQKKDVSHDLISGKFGNNQTFSAMGG
jgi:cyclic pyranopterin phosphate synthase